MGSNASAEESFDYIQISRLREAQASREGSMNSTSTLGETALLTLFNSLQRRDRALVVALAVKLSTLDDSSLSMDERRHCLCLLESILKTQLADIESDQLLRFMVAGAQ